MALKVIIAAGGTGGHIFPGLAIAMALVRLVPDVSILFVGAKGKMEMQKVPFNRSQIWRNIGLPLKLVKSRWQANKILGEFKPNIVVGVGGYASFPMLSAAQAAGIPTLIQEQNSYIGKTNNILSKKAKAFCIAYPELIEQTKATNMIVTGNPVRENLTQPLPPKAIALQHFGLSSNKMTLLAVGGSLGALTINESIKNNISSLLAANLQLIWQTGNGYIEPAAEVKAKYQNEIY
ncbi:MAG: UDP-N-acetylglucosamine--N-acetylmuramyl-(pentapeptide) pyrophosphoryl-undecaprenol N-acetylglucosamine transferase, partial [Chitinophagia bacterium]|nr:UDP-N-acetylglucosamine--N-acetylmuramyl-(pentapeptide) pyrophosphoryl-undecaprenol N-acetylglucosamine transferase [Chitinophagia bacterium]